VCGNVPVDVGGGALTTCAVLAGGEVWCWGRDVFGEVGLDPGKANAACTFWADKCQTVPVKVQGITNAVAVATGSEATCALEATGAVQCWGSNQNDLLGHDPATDATCTKAGGPNPGQQGPCSPSPKPVALPQGVIAKKLAVSSYTACIVSTTGDVYCWGTNLDGEIKSPVGGKVWQPTKRASGATDVAVSSSAENFSTICIAGAGGVTSCWGQASDDAALLPGYSFFPTTGAAGCQFDRCDPTPHVVPTNMQSQTGQVLADSVAVGYYAACALKGGAAQCWGHDGYGQRGNGTTVMALFDPVAPAGVPALAAVSNLGLTTALLDTTGQVWSLGWNGMGQIGDGTYGGTACAGPGGGNCVTTAKKVPALTNIARVSSALTGSVALTGDHKVLTWGANYTGELGHAPGGVGDSFCPGQSTYFCNPTPTVVQGLP
jgi:alpha-tubulin suppressor-like RCC1 family protein